MSETRDGRVWVIQVSLTKLLNADHSAILNKYVETQNITPCLTMISFFKENPHLVDPFRVERQSAPVLSFEQAQFLHES